MQESIQEFRFHGQSKPKGPLRRYEVTYADGRVRGRQLRELDAERLAKAPGVAKVKELRR